MLLIQVNSIKGVHGIGEQIRGHFNKGVDDIADRSIDGHAARQRDGKNEETIKKGDEEVRKGIDTL